jgi:hypothetical protein
MAKIIRLAMAPVNIVFIVESESANFHTNPFPIYKNIMILLFDLKN